MDRQRIVAGLDIHKDSIYLCDMCHKEAIIFQKTYGTLTPELHQMCTNMVNYGVSEAAMESTATYWVPVWNVLCDCMLLKLVNPYFIKQLPGRKSDVKDTQWIAECLLKNLIRGSFVPEPSVQDMRKYNRRIFDLNDDLVYNANKLDSALQRCGFRLSNYVTKINGKSYQSCITAIINGETDPTELVKLVHGRTINKHGRDIIIAALTADFHRADIDLIRQYKEMIDIITRQIGDCQESLTALCKKHFPTQYERLQTIPSVKECATTAIIAETGAGMGHFQKASNLVGWCGLKPRNCFFSNFSYVQCTQKRKTKMKIQVAIARKILVAVWHMLTNDENFIDVYLKRIEKKLNCCKKSKNLNHIWYNRPSLIYP